MKKLTLLFCLCFMLTACGKHDDSPIVANPAPAPEQSDSTTETPKEPVKPDVQSEAPETPKTETPVTPQAPEPSTTPAQPEQPAVDPTTQSITDAVLKKNSLAKIGQIVAYDNGYTYQGTSFVPAYNDFYMPEANNAIREQTYHELSTKMQADAEGSLVFLAGQSQPSYYVEPDNSTAYLVKSAAFTDKQGVSYYAFLPFRNETLSEEYTQVLTIAQEKAQDALLETSALQYEIVGESLEFTNSHIAILGKATRAYDGDTYTGKIRIALDSKADVTLSPDGMATVMAYSTIDEPGSTLSDGKWFQWQAFVSTNASYYAETQHNAQQQLDDIAYYAKIVASEPPIAGDAQTYQLQGYNIGLTLPTDWSAQGDTCVNVATTQTAIILAQDASHEFGGMLCSFMVAPVGGDIPPDSQIVFTDGVNNLLYLLPTDVQFAPEQQQAYHNMQMQLPDILNTLTVSVSGS